MPTQPKSPLALDLNHQFKISQKLEELAYALVAGVEVEMRRKDLIFFALADKTLMTAAAIRSLAEKGFVDDGLALVRVLIEGLVNAGYVLESNDQVAEDYADFPLFSAWKEFQNLRIVGPEVTAETSEQDIKKMEDDYNATKMRYEKNRNQDWAKDNIFVRARLLDQKVGFNLFMVMMNAAWRKASAYVHSTASSLSSRISEDEKHVNIRREPTPKEGGGVVYVANMAIFTLIALLDLRLGKKKVSEWRKLYEEWSGPTSPLDAGGSIENYSEAKHS